MSYHPTLAYDHTYRDPIKVGKVSELYDLEPDAPELIIVTQDRISAADHILPSLIPDKGRLLQQMSVFWYRRLRDIIPTHFITNDNQTMPVQFQAPEFQGRSMRVRRLDMYPVECIVRGYLTGSGLVSYRKHQEVCGIHLPSGLVESSPLPEPIFTPTTKAETGHDQNITFEEMVELIGDREIAEYLRDRSIELYKAGSAYALSRGIIIADTKFEFGASRQGEIYLADEVLTPDTSRFWPLQGYEEGHLQPSYDKQPVRNWLYANWNGFGQPPELPEGLIEQTRDTYVEIYERLTGNQF